ncbi:MAG: hypothetical protein AAF393_06820 [Pseudomonadota bacterium]
MALKDWFDTSDPGTTKLPSGPVRVGWFLNETRSGVVYQPPERIRSAEVNRKHAKSASRCPAIINMESRYFLVRVPYSLHLRFVRDQNGKPGLRNMAGDASPVRGNVLNKKLHVTAEHEWRYADRPTIQVSLPYTFIADEPVYAIQTDAFMHYRADAMPGTIFGGRFAIQNWPRPLMWAFEWHDTKRDLILKRGQPWFYIQFETLPQDRSVSMVEAELTPELSQFMDHTSAAVNYVNQSFQLLKDAERSRPTTLIQPVKR